MTQQPKQFSYEYASIFQDASVVAAYVHRPPYPPSTFVILAGALDKTESPRRVLNTGCGTGQMTAGLLAHVDGVDAVDISAAMIKAANRCRMALIRRSGGSWVGLKRWRCSRPMR